MRHGISDQDWNDYLDGQSAAEARDRIENHLIGCMECWEFYEQMSSVTRVLHEAGEEARHGLTLDDKQLHSMMHSIFSRLAADTGDPLPDPQVLRRLNVLETVLAPFCGTEKAIRALQTAAKNSPARSLERVTSDNWEHFMEKLTDIAAAMCGKTFASLIRERGQF